MLSEHTVDGDIALDEIGPKGISELRELQNYLRRSGFVGSGIEFRYAPSIVTRSEAELLGVSMPRFALRAYLGDDRRSFVNTRRLQQFSKEVGGWVSRLQESARWKRVATPRVVEELELCSKPGDIIASSPSIADSVLAAPAELAERYHVLEVELGMAYGESSPVWGTPFMKHVRLSGLCAQAVCLMAGALLHDHRVPAGARKPGVQGVAEVSAVIGGDEYNELRLTGLTPQEIVTYFEKVGRSAATQISFQQRHGLTAQKAFEKCLRAYLVSDMPVIVPVNIATLNRLGVYRNNGVVHANAEEDSDRVNHAVLAVGVRRGRREESDDKFAGDFLINDPAALPFMRISTTEMWRCTESSGEASSRLFGNFIPVTPASVTVPLESWRDSHGTLRHGLFDLAYTVQKGKPWQKFDPGEFALTRATDVHRAVIIPPELRGRLAALMKEKGRGEPDHYFWVQAVAGSSTKSGVWLWDAQGRCDRLLDNVNGSELDARRLLCAHVRTGAKEIVSFPKKRGRPDIEIDDRWKISSPAVIPEPALMTSFCLSGLPEEARHWPVGVPCELYAFMHRDKLFHRFGTKPKSGSVTERMAELSKDKDACGKLAETISSVLERRKSHVVAIASFLPEVTRRPGGSAKDPETLRAREAAVSLVHLAKAFVEINRRRGIERGPFVVELVGGSRVGGCWAAKIEDPVNAGRTEEAIFVNRYRREQVIDELIEGLEAVVGLANLEPEAGVRLSVEMEPGSNFVLRDPETLGEFCRALDKSKTLSPLTGVNLDVGHWALCGMDPENFAQKHPGIFRRIVHAHISDVGQAHFGDACVGDVGLGECDHLVGLNSRGNARERGTLEWFHACFRSYRPWLQLLFEAAAARKNPEFSGYLSVELEACRSPYQAIISLGRLRSLLSAISME